MESAEHPYRAPPRHVEAVVCEYAHDHIEDLRIAGVEAVRPDVEREIAIGDTARQTADSVLLFNHSDRESRAGELPREHKTRDAGANHHHVAI